MAMISSKVALRAASRIHASLRHTSQTSAYFGLPDTMWAICESKVRRIEKAEQRRWLAASRQLKDSLRLDLEILQDHLARVSTQLPPGPPPLIASTKQIYDDLMALNGEFESVDVDMRRCAVTVCTDPIVLEEVYLGPFEIVLHWNVFGSRDAYDVIAVKPHPSGQNDEVYHPHVMGTDLCEGDAKLPIRRALEQGRLFDFFLIVRQTLETYNPASAHADLDEWTDRRCADCDVSMSEDDSYSCDRCDRTVCGSCEMSCLACCSSLCGECWTYCELCDQPFCSSCLTRCSNCQVRCCKECLHDESKCRKCIEAASEAHDAADAETPVHADCVGEAGVPA
jgi:hypothetical protein